MNNICSEPACPIILDSTCVFYTGANLIYTGVNTNDNLQIVLQKIDAKFRDAGLGYVFTNGLIQTAPGQPVKLGGVLVNDTIINSQGFTFGLSGTIGASAFITTGGTSSQFVKGDGSLDSGPYQPAGNYITALTGDGTASGPGSSVFTLATVFNAPATYGSSTRVPIITVNDKGLVTNVTTTIISVPSSSISIDGDVYGYGNTGVPFNLTLQNVLSTPGVYGSATSIPVINVNSKGLITSISQVAISGGGGSGTVSSVSVTPGTGISASVATPTTTPNITITNTAPDQIVSLASGTGISVTGTYPSFTIATTGSGSTPTLQEVTDVGNIVTDIGNTGSSQLLFDQYNIQETGGSGVGMNVNIGGSPYLYVQASGGSTTYYMSSGIAIGPYNMTFPALTANRYLTLSVNGNYADLTGAVTIPVGTGTVTGTGTTNYVSKWSSSSALTDSQIFDNGTNVGIGTATPGYKLDVNGEINTNNGIRIGTNGAKTGFYGGANILDTWAGNSKIATWGLAAAGGTLYDHFNGWVFGATATGESKSFRISSSLTSNGANSANLSQLVIDPTYNQGTFGTGILRGIYYNPTVSVLNGSPHIAYQNTSGDIIHGNLATGGADEMVTVDTNGKLKKQAIPTGSSVGFEMNFLLMGA